jgi:putative ABC transport system permease protein
MTAYRLALLNLFRRKVPTLITIFSIALSVACCGILLRLNELSENRYSGFAKGGDAIVGAKAGGIEIILGALNGEGPYPGYLPFKLFQSLRAETAVKFEDGAESKPTFIQSIIPLVYFAKFKDFRVLGTDESFIHRPKESEDLQFSEGHWAGEDSEIVLGSSVAEKEKLKVGEFVSIDPWAFNHSSIAFSLKVAGILKPSGTAWDRMLYSNLATAQKTLASMDLSHESIWGSDVLNYFLVYLKPGTFESLSSVVNKRTVGQAVLVTEQKARLKELSGTGTKVGLFVMFLVLALGALSVTSMLITRFEAMSLQLAVLRALGYKRKVIGQWLLWEGFLLGVFACLIGIILDFEDELAVLRTGYFIGFSSSPFAHSILFFR